MIADFENQQHDAAEIATALKMIRAFKECESEEEWNVTPFAAWSMLEELEEMLERMLATGSTTEK